MDNKICAKPMYKCAVCDEVYDSIEQRTNCERLCLKKQEEEKRREAEAKKAVDKQLRKDAVDEAIKRAAKLYSEFVKDYGHYEYDGEIIPNVFWPNKIWHMFF